MIATIEIPTPVFFEAEIIRLKRAQLESLWLKETFQVREYESKSKEELLSLVEKLLIVEPVVFKEIIDEASLNREDKAFVLNQVADELTIRIPDFLADAEEIVELGLVQVVINRAHQVEEECNCIRYAIDDVEEAFKREDALFFGYPVLCDMLISLKGAARDEVMAEIKDLKEKTDNLEIKKKCSELLTKETLWKHL